jgi:hypothetical protein
VQQEIGPRHGVAQFLVRRLAIRVDPALNNPQPGKPTLLNCRDLGRQIGRGPENNLGLRKVPLQERQHSRRMGDIADVDNLPGRTQQNPRPTPAGSARGRRQSGCQAGLQKSTSLHG